MLFSRVFKRAYTSKLSRLEFTFGHIVFSVEATIFVRVIDGSWPDGLRGLPLLFSVTKIQQNITQVLVMRESSYLILDVRKCLMLVMAR